MEAYRRTIKKCIVPGCNDLYSKRHTFPRNDPELFNKWVKQVQNQLLDNKSYEQIYKSYVVCHLHFSEQFKVPGTKRGLMKNAFPTEFLSNSNQHSTSSTTESIFQADEGSTSGTLRDKLDKLTPHPLEKGIIKLKLLLLSDRLASISSKTTSGYEKEAHNEETSKQSLVKRENNDINYIVKLEKTQFSTNKNDSAENTTYKMENDSVSKEYYIKEEVDDQFVNWEEGAEPNGVIKFEQIELTPEEWTNEPLHTNEIEKVLYDEEPGSKKYVKNLLGEYSVKEEQADEDNFESNNFLGQNEEIGIEFDATTYPIRDRTENEAGQNAEESHDIDVKENVLDETHVKLELERASNEEVIVDESDFGSMDDFDGNREDMDQKSHEKQSQHTTRTVAESKTSRKYKCTECLYETEISSNFWNHKKIHKPRSDRKLFKCNVCSGTYVRKYYLERHKLLHVNPEQRSNYTCDVCGFQTIHKRVLLKHNNTHENETMQYKCRQCKYQTNVYKDLQKHNATHKARSKKNRPTFDCDKCDFKAVYKFLLKRHEAKHTSLRYKCKKCPYRTDHLDQLENHRLSHQEAVECTSCGGKYNSKQDLKRHMVLHIMDHTDHSKYKCDVCDYKTFYKSTMRLHKATHENSTEARFECD